MRYVWAGIVAILIGPLFLLSVLLISPANDPCIAENINSAQAADPGNIPAEAVAGYGKEQLQNARYIMHAAYRLGLTVRDQTIGVMTAMGESSLRVLDHGDAVGPDSRGLFQQRANGAWGSYEDRMDPHRSATNFFLELIKIKNRDDLEPTIVAHRVQRNADPHHYARYWSAAVAVVTALTGKPVASTANVSSEYRLAAGTHPHAIDVANFIGVKFGLKTITGYRAHDPYPDHKTGRALDLMINDIANGKVVGDKIANYLIEHADQLGIEKILWKQQSWRVATRAWKPMEDRGNVSANHYDHLHVMVNGTISTIPGCKSNIASNSHINQMGWAAPGAGPRFDGYGMRKHPITGEWKMHNGIDLGAGGCGGSIYAAHNGVVIGRGFDRVGNGYIRIDHGNDIVASYVHMYESGMLVRVGDKVTAGQLIAKTGSSGQSTGCHLHFGIRQNGSWVDPHKFMLDRGVKLGS